MARINLTLPDNTKERMDKWERENWSKIANNEFIRYVSILETKEVNMNEAQLERLRQSRDEYYEEERAEGVKFGKEWALDIACFEDLKRVEELNELIQNGEEVNSMGLYEALEMNYELDSIFGDTDGDPSDYLIKGFIEGVVEIKEAI